MEGRRKENEVRDRETGEGKGDGGGSVSNSYCFVTADGLNLCTEHDACEEREEESFEDAEQSEDED